MNTVLVKIMKFNVFQYIKSLTNGYNESLYIYNTLLLSELKQEKEHASYVTCKFKYYFNIHHVKCKPSYSYI